MKKTFTLILVAAMVLFIFSSCVPETAEASSDKDIHAVTADDSIQEDSATLQEESTEGYGAKGAMQSDGYTLEEMLSYAIQDEYLARQEYESIMDEYGAIRPFSNIIRAEETHIELLKELYEVYELSIPEDTSKDYVMVPENLADTYPIGVQAEIDNIAMYEIFLEQDLPDDVKEVFIELRDASKNHLVAFEKGPRNSGRNH